ncbi:hypothetical protein H2248_000845 [Termitomyces sp. 'cryptogamus']|nr:hypothetical protein H2248_000845 [Termitomyces sp. 'cryptogamus']
MSHRRFPVFITGVEIEAAVSLAFLRLSVNLHRNAQNIGIRAILFENANLQPQHPQR